MKQVIRFLDGVEIRGIDYMGRGKGHFKNKQVLIENALPGEVVDARVLRKHKGKLLGRTTKVHKAVADRTEPFCQHFELCGGCKWQHISYEKQLDYKADFVRQAFSKLEGIPLPEQQPVMAAPDTRYYRNKMEFSFSNKRWITAEEIESGKEITDLTGLGLHPAGAFDKVLDLKECFLQPEPSNSIRLAVKRFADEHNYTFFDQRQQEGLLRNLTIRTSTSGEILVIVSFYYEDEEKRKALLDFLLAEFPQISALFYVINDSKNDIITDMPIQHYHGKEFMEESLGDVRFKVGPISFFQTNSRQARNLYDVALDFAELSGEETVFDLYTGIGSIALYMAGKCKSILGIEYVPEAIEDAKKNAALNSITNCEFIAGDMKDILTPGYLEGRPVPDVVMTDPPRAGMHPKVAQTLRDCGAKRIVYISCNPQTQADDLLILSEKYNITHIQPVDMFPQTYHVENVVRLELKD